jgi:hypothetical protein
MTSRSRTVPRHPDDSSTDLEGLLMPSSRDQHPLGDATPGQGRRDRGGRGRSVLVTVLVAVVVALVAVTATVLIMAPRGREAVEASTETPSSSAASAEPTGLSPSPSTSQVTADGCLGGAVELNRAVVSAQEQAPLTQEGAAAFTATLLRWTNASPAPAYKADTANQILAQDATTLVRDYVAAVNPSSVTTAADFSTGRFYVESYTPTRAVVSFLATATGTSNGSAYASATISGAVVLVAQNGTWHFQDLTSERTVSDLSAVSSPYTGGC